MKTVIIGGGPGGYVAAIRLAQLGAEVTLIEKNSLGGTCLNVGCIPTKALIHSADLYNEVKNNSAKNGVVVNGEIRCDFQAMQKKKASVVKQLVMGVKGLMKANGVTVINGRASFLSDDEIEIETAEEKIRMNFDKAIIASGSVPASVPIEGADTEGVVDSTGALSFESVPESLCIIGGGVIGVEMAHIYSRLGSKVTVVEMLPDILVNMDSDITGALKKVMKKNKIDIFTETRVQKISGGDDMISVFVKSSDGDEKEIQAEKVLMCVGRRPATEDLCLEKTSVELERNRIKVDGNFRTNAKNIYAIGDCIGGICLAHVASAEGIAAAEDIMGKVSSSDLGVIPSCVYTSPELSGVGITEREAKEKNVEYKVGKFPMAASGKALIEGETSGLVKIISESESGKLLGVHICGPCATELIAEAALAIKMGAKTEDIINTVHAHPSVAESIQEAAHAVFGNAINMPPVK